MEISKSILKVDKRDKNLCMFTCMINALRSSELRLAFAAGNAENPGLMFETVIYQMKRI